MLKIHHLFYTAAIIIYMTGCADTTTEEQTGNEQSVQPIHYEDTRNQTSSNQDNDTKWQAEAPSLESFDREEAEELQTLVRKHPQIEDAQVVTEANRIVVAAKMKRGTNSQDFEKISRDIEQMLHTDKQLFIYNNTAKWERVKDFYAREEANRMGQDMERLFQNLFE